VKDETERLLKEYREEINRASLLVAALYNVLVKDGVIGKGTFPSGPELLLAAEEYCKQEGSQCKSCNTQLCSKCDVDKEDGTIFDDSWFHDPDMEARG